MMAANTVHTSSNRNPLPLSGLLHLTKGNTPGWRAAVQALCVRVVDEMQGEPVGCGRRDERQQEEEVVVEA